MVGLIAATAALLAPATGTGERTCAERVEAPGPVVARPQPVFFYAAHLRRVSAAELRRGALKAAVDVAAATTATVSVAARSRERVSLAYDLDALPRRRLYRVEDGQRSVRFIACAADEPRFSGPGTVGPRTGFNGGLIATRRTCADLLVRVAGEPRARRVRIPIGRSC